MYKKIRHKTFVTISEDIEKPYELYLNHKLKAQKGDGSCYFWQHYWIVIREDNLFWTAYKSKRMVKTEVRRVQIIKTRKCLNCGQIETYFQHQDHSEFAMHVGSDGNLLKDMREYEEQKDWIN